MTGLSLFLSRNNLFHLGLSSIYLKKTFLNLFSIFDFFFLKNPGFWGPLGTRHLEKRENSTVLEFNEIRLGN